jgi:hypothetical protein
MSEVSRLNIPENTIDLADIVIFDNAAIIVNDFFQKGYRLVDTKDHFRNELLQKNYNAMSSSAVITDISEAPADYEKIKQFIQGLSENGIYNCRNSNLYPQITLTQLSRPGVKWTLSGDSWIEYGKYIAKKIYYRNGNPKISLFIESIKNADSLYIVRSNSFVEFENTFETENSIARVPYIGENWTWKEIFYRATLIPAEFGKIKLVDKPPWKDAIPSILRDCSPKTAQKITLNQYMRGVQYAGSGQY